MREKADLTGKIDLLSMWSSEDNVYNAKFLRLQLL